MPKIIHSPAVAGHRLTIQLVTLS